MSIYSKQRAEHDRLCGRVTTAPALLRLTTTSNGLPGASNLARGMYRVTSTVDCYFIQTNGGTVTATNSSFLQAGVVEFLPVTEQHNNVVAISDASDGYLYISKLAK